MGIDSIWHWLLLLVIVLVVFGTGKLTKIGPDLGNAVRGFKKALQGDDDDKAKADKQHLEADPPPAADSTEAKQKHRDSSDSR